MASGGQYYYAVPVAAPLGQLHDPTRRRLVRDLALLAPLVVPALMGAALLLLR